LDAQHRSPKLSWPEPLIDIRGLGFMDMDALHLAFAENLKLNYFVTCDDAILGRQGSVKIAIINPVDLLKEYKK